MMTGRTIFAMTMAAAFGIAAPASAGQLAGVTGAVARPLTNTLGALQGAAGRVNADAGLGDTGRGGFGGFHNPPTAINRTISPCIPASRAMSATT